MIRLPKQKQLIKVVYGMRPCICVCCIALCSSGIRQQPETIIFSES